VVADAEFGDWTAPRHTSHRWTPPYALSVSCVVTVCAGTPPVQPLPQRVAPDVCPLRQRDLGDTPEAHFTLVHLPATASLETLVRSAHHP
jgi:hypothetical protein